MKSNKNWFKTFFKKDFYNFDFIPKKTTLEEVNFIIKACDIKRGIKILDVPCGVGRHSVVLAKKGFDVIGVDYSQEYIKDALKSTTKMGLKNIKFIINDMRKINFKEEFDLVINMFTSFGYFSDKGNFLFLKKIYKSLKKGGKFLIDVKNGVFVRNNLKEKNWEIIGNTIELQELIWIDKKTIKNIWHKIENGKIKTRIFYLKIYDEKSIKKILRSVGFNLIKLYGGFDFSSPNDKSKRLIAVCEKPYI